MPSPRPAPRPPSSPHRRPPRAGVLTLRRGIERTDEHLARLDDRLRWDERKTPETIAAERRKGYPDPIEAIVRSHRPGATERLFTRTSGASGRVEPASAPPQDAWALVALGLRDAFGPTATAGGDWLTPDALAQLAYSRDEQGRAVLTGPAPLGYPRDLVFDPAHGYALVAYRIRDKDKDSAKIFLDVTATDFRPVNGLPVPFTMTLRRFNISYENPILTWRAAVTRCEVGGPANTPDHYRIAWPEGIDVIDARPSPPVRIRIRFAGEKTPD